MRSHPFWSDHIPEGFMQLGVIEVPTLKELFVNKIKEQILSGNLSVGESLPSERQLVEETHISKTMVHAGLVELERMGFVEILPRRGTVVANYAETGTMDTLKAVISHNGGRMTASQTRSFLDARIAIEGSALRLVAENATEEDMAYLEEKLAAAVKAAERLPFDSAELAEALFNFQRAVCLKSQNEFFPLLYNEFKPIIMSFWAESIKTFGAEANVHLASRYLDYIRQRDPDGAYNRLLRSVNEYLNCCLQQ